MRERLAQTFFRYGDVVLGGAIATLAVVQIAGYDEPLWARIAAGAGAVVLGAVAAFRTRYPLALLSLLVVSIPLGALLPRRIGDVEAVGLLVVLAIYTAAAHASDRRAVLAGLLTIVLGIVALMGDPEETNLAGVVFFSLVIGGPWVAGRIVRRRRLNEARLEREKAEAEAAIAEERTRIARELHDVVAHAISVIVLQARGGRRVLDEGQRRRARRWTQSSGRPRRHSTRCGGCSGC